MKKALPFERLLASAVDFLPYIYFSLRFVLYMVAGEMFTTLLSYILLLGFPILQLYYFTKSRTLGKRIWGLKVINKETQSEVGFFKMLLRETLGKWLSGMIAGLGFLWILIDDDNQAWHDKLIDSQVVNTK